MVVPDTSDKSIATEVETPSSNIETPVTDMSKTEYVTRSGRTIRPPERYNPGVVD